MSASARPGTGGRRKRLDVGFEIEATRELSETYGEPDEITYRGSLLLVWEMDLKATGSSPAASQARPSRVQSPGYAFPQPLRRVTIVI